jgi:hypothetical protein
MLKPIYLLTLISLLSACIPCHTTNIELPPIPDSIINLIPYKNEQTIKFKHSAGSEIEFKTQRTQKWDYSGCSECCKYSYHYQTDQTWLTTDYPLFNMNLMIYSFDSLNYNLDIYVGQSSVGLPANKEMIKQYFSENLFDSLTINDKMYYDVLKLYTSHWTTGSADIVPDSIYYNYSFGILKIIMSNEETYTLLSDLNSTN